MSKIAAVTTTKYNTYPAYINFTRQDDGSVIVYAREAESVTDGVYVCGFARDKGQYGRCTPGDEHCNNYCNMAPEKGRMVDSPKPFPSFAMHGGSVSFKLTEAEFSELREAIAAMLPTPTNKAEDHG